MSMMCIFSVSKKIKSATFYEPAFFSDPKFPHDYYVNIKLEMGTKLYYFIHTWNLDCN